MEWRGWRNADAAPGARLGGRGRRDNRLNARSDALDNRIGQVDRNLATLEGRIAGRRDTERGSR